MLHARIVMVRTPACENVDVSFDGLEGQEDMDVEPLEVEHEEWMPDDLTLFDIPWHDEEIIGQTCD